MSYGSDACYYTVNLKTYTVKIVGENTLSFYLDKILDDNGLANYGKEIELKRNAIEEETASHRGYYVTNPIDGQSYSGNEDEALGDCSYRYR